MLSTNIYKYFNILVFILGFVYFSNKSASEPLIDINQLKYIVFTTDRTQIVGKCALQFDVSDLMLIFHGYNLKLF